jgi:RNA polymerase sigma factor (sigma-70 family)
MSRLELAKAALGHKTVSGIMDIENMKANPIDKEGNWKKWAEKLAAFFVVDPEDLWPKAILETKETVAERCVSKEDLLLATSSTCTEHLALPPSENFRYRELAETIDQILSERFKPREKIVIMERFYKGSTLGETAKKLGVNRERARQIEGKVLRALRHPLYTSGYKLKEYFEELSHG